MSDGSKEASFIVERIGNVVLYIRMHVGARCPTARVRTPKVNDDNCSPNLRASNSISLVSASLAMHILDGLVATEGPA